MTAVAEGPAATTSAVTPEMALERATKWANDYAAHLTERAEQSAGRPYEREWDAAPHR